VLASPDGHEAKAIRRLRHAKPSSDPLDEPTSAAGHMVAAVHERADTVENGGAMRRVLLHIVDRGKKTTV
jgi:hypothetical protein